MLKAARNNSLSEALVKLQAADINLVDVMRYSAQRVMS
jgi:hypothetical protein